MSGRRLALAALDYLDVPAARFVETAAEAGFDAVTLRVAGSSAPAPADLNGSAEGLRATRRALARTGLDVLDVEVLRMRPTMTRGEVQAAAQVAAELGAQHLLVVNEALDREAAAAQLHLIGEVAAAVGVRPCLEFMPFSRCRTLDEALATVEAADTGAGVLVDALHLHRSGGGAAQLLAAAREHGDALFPYVQLCDAPAQGPSAGGLREEALHRRLLPGEGDLALTELLRGLPPTLPIAVEAPTAGTSSLAAAARARRTFEATRALLATIDGATGTN